MVADHYGTFNSTTEDASKNIENVTINATLMNNTVSKFVAYRKLNTTDTNNKDLVLQCG